MSASKAAVDKWGAGVAKSFIRVPFELLVHYKCLGLTEEDLLIAMWIEKHQWSSSKAAFPHPNKLAIILGVTPQLAKQKLFLLKDRDFITLEPTKNNSGNYHQDLRPLRNSLRIHINDCSKRIDTSSLKDASIKNYDLTDASTSIDTSILQEESKGTENLSDIARRKYKKDDE